MPKYSLTDVAEFDLKEIARYTLDNWGVDATVQYMNGLTETFNKIGSGSVIGKRCSELDLDSELFVTKFRYHYVFYLPGDKERSEIVGVIHEKRDFIHHLRDRLK